MDSVYYYYESPLRVSVDSKAPEICVFPNPCTHDVFISGISSFQTENEFLLFNSLGKCVGKLQALEKIGERLHFSIPENLLPGVYILMMVNNQEHQVLTTKIVL